MNEQMKYYNKYYFVLKNAFTFKCVYVHTLFENRIRGFSKSSLHAIQKSIAYGQFFLIQINRQDRELFC